MRLLILAVCILPNCISFLFPSPISFTALHSQRSEPFAYNLLGSKLIDGYDATGYDATPLMVELKNVIEDGPIARIDRDFLINGWRWHTISVIRDLNRFSGIVSDIVTNMSSMINEEDTFSTTSERDIARVFLCHKFVCDFNYKGLSRVETTLFFPWLTGLLPDSARPLIEDILLQHSLISILSLDIGVICTRLSEDENTEVRDVIAEMNAINSSLREMIQCISKIRHTQEAIFVPYIAAYVSSSDQEVFNRKVIRKLGLLDSQVHLVSMAEAIRDEPAEMVSFHKQIPRIAQMMLPLWRKQLYFPKASCLE